MLESLNPGLNFRFENAEILQKNFEIICKIKWSVNLFLTFIIREQDNENQTDTSSIELCLYLPSYGHRERLKVYLMR